MRPFDQYRKVVEEMNLGAKSSTYCYVKSSLKSTNLMTRLKLNSEAVIGPSDYGKPIDVLYARLQGEEDYERIELAIVYQIPKEVLSALWSKNTPKAGNTITFTEFKKNKVSFWQDIDDVRKACRLPLNQDSILCLWNRPYILKAVTEFDKFFRKEWQNGDLVFKGNNYGDTSEFYILGSVIRKPQSP